ncbi:hypothetical protein VM1G_11629 [Cytospora mali]|uniref:Uncharacterized protein n=1 Tax=Cytospora mali TaxID=578113 RepID=A0A194VYD2_CYTMA|nr:hypothetical protein VM1G_11629 [Valsa mali]
MPWSGRRRRREMKSKGRPYVGAWTAVINRLNSLDKAGTVNWAKDLELCFDFGVSQQENENAYYEVFSHLIPIPEMKNHRSSSASGPIIHPSPAGDDRTVLSLATRLFRIRLKIMTTTIQHPSQSAKNTPGRHSQSGGAQTSMYISSNARLVC